jgi:hypothetical protein
MRRLLGRRFLTLSLPVVALLPVTVFGQALSITSGPYYGTFSVGDVQSALIASGGVPPYTWSISGGSLPAGVYIRTDTPSFFPPAASAGLIGVATAPTGGAANFTIMVTDAASNIATQNASLTVTPLTITDPYNLPNGFTNLNYSWTLNTAGATGGVTWSIANGNSLPPGLSLNNGVLSGIPTANGFFNFSLIATDSTGTVGRGYNLAIYGPGFVTGAGLGNLIQGVAIGTPISIVGQGGTPPYTFFSSNLPPGLSLSQNGPLAAAITGTPSCCQGSSYFFNITIVDSTNLSYNQQFAINFLGSNGSGGLPQVTVPVPASDATLGEFQAYGFGASSGKQPYTWSATGLPAGMQLMTASQFPEFGINAQIGGAPPATGSYSVVVSVTDSSSPAVTIQRTFNFNAQAMDNEFPFNPTRGSPYSFYVRPIGGAPPFAWTLVGGALPSGLSLNTSTGVISGTPQENGNFSATITITSSPASGSLQVTRVIGFQVNTPTNPYIQVNNASPLPDALLNAQYSFQLNACCASGSIVWSVSNGSLPTGLGLNPSTGLISGVPNAAQGPVTFTIQATDSANGANFGARVLTINVSPIAFSIPTPNGNVGAFYSTTFIASGGTGPYTWALAANSQPLPANLSFSLGGVLSGTPASPGGFGFNFIVTDGANHSFTGFAFVNIYPAGSGPPLAISTGGNLGIFTIGQVIFGLNATGGTGNYTWSVASGSLPPGVYLAPYPFGSPGQTGLVGVATTAGTYPFSLTVSDGNSSLTQSFTIQITNLTVKDIGLPDAFVGAPFSYTFTPLNAAGGVTFTPTSPALPAWLSLSAGGVLAGMPTAPGTYTINFSVFDGANTAFRGYQLVVYAVDLTTPGALPNATQGVFYSTSLAAGGGTGGYQYMITGGSLPPGLSLNNGVVSGTTNGGPGVYWFYLTVNDSSNNSYQKTMTIDVVGPPVQNQITLGEIDDPIVGIGYSWQVPTCCGGVAPFTWSAAGLPPGISLRSGSGVTSDYVGPGWGEIWGVPSTAGDYTITLTVTDSLGAQSSLQFPFHVSPMTLVSIFGPANNNPNATINAPYSDKFQIIGGSGLYSSAAQISGAIPDGLTLNTSTATSGYFTLSGTPIENGSFDPIFEITDSSSNTLTRSYALNINNVAGGININNGPSLQATAGGNFSLQLSACCVASYNWSVASGTLPSGLTLTPGGLLSGTVNTAGTYSFLIEAADAAGVAAPGFRLFTLNSSPINITTNGLPFGNVNTSYNQNFTATGGTGNLTWSLAFGNYLPPGLTLSSAGTLSGTPTATGQYGFQVVVTDQNMNTASRFYSISIYGAGQLPPLTFATGPDLGTWHTGTDWIALGANGGNGIYAWSLVSGTLPPGLALRSDVPSFFAPNQQAGVIGVATTAGSYQFTLSVTSATQTISQTFNIKVSRLNLQDATPPDGFVNVPFTYTFTPIANAGAVTFSANSNSTNGVMPPGLTLSSTGVLSGTPNTAGSYIVGMNIFDGTDTQYQQYNLYIYAIRITTPGLLPNATQYGAYSTSIAATGGAGNYTWTANCCLPPGLNLSTDGTISGTINGGPGLYTFVLTATDSNNISNSAYMAIDVVGSPIAPMRIANLVWSDAVLGNGYGNVQSVCCGGTAPFTWTVTGLPPGMTYEPNSNSFLNYPSSPGGVQIYGIPQAAGNYNVTYTATDATGATTSATVPLHVSVLDVNLPGTYSAYNLPNGTINLPYTSTFLVLGGSPPYSFAGTTNGEFPDGLQLSAPGLLTVSGTPLENGGFNRGLQFSDSSGNTLYRWESLQISGGSSTINVNNNWFDGYYLGTTPVGAFYSNQFSACCVPSYNWSVAAGSPPLPVGLSLSPSGQLSGTPTAAGTYTFLLAAADAGNSANAGIKSFTLVVTPIAITTASLPYGDVGVAYNPGNIQQLTATGGTGALTWTQTFTDGSQLPPGLTLNANGSITGTPTSAGAYNIIVQATDTSGNIAIRFFTINIYQSGPPPLNLPIGPNLCCSSVGPIQYQLQASGGTPPYHYSLTPGATPVPGMRVQDGQPLPTFFSLNNGTGGFIGVVTAPGVYNTSVRVTDSLGVTFDRAVTLTILPVEILDINPLPNATLGTPYSYTLHPYGGSGNYIGTGLGLPPGLSLNAQGQITGTPTVAGSYGVNFGLADAASPSAEIFPFYNFTVDPFAITDSGVLPELTSGVLYSHTFSAPGCGSGCAWSFIGSAPGGLTLSGAGTLSGTITNSNGFTSNFTVQTQGSNGTVRKNFTLISPPTAITALSITSTISTTSVVGGQFSNQLNATGGVPPYSWSVVDPGDLAPGVGLLGPGENFGLNPGMYYLAGHTMGLPNTYNFTVKVTDSANNTATKVFSLAVSPLFFAYTNLPLSGNPLIYNSAYTQPILVQGGSGNYTSWTTAGPIYPGLSVNSSTGVISGTPANTGFLSTLWTVTDDQNNVATAFVSLNAASNATTEITLGGPANGTLVASGANNTFNLTPSGGTPPYTIMPVGNLPAGVTLVTGNSLTANFGANTYDLEVSPRGPGILTFTLQVQDFNGVTGAHTYSLIAPDFTPPFNTTLPSGTVGAAYSAAPFSTSSASPTWALAPGSALPLGLSIASGVISGTPSTPGQYLFGLTLSDVSGAETFSFSLTISALAIINPQMLPTATIGVPYSYQMTVAGGSNPTWSWTNGGSGLPPGLSISSSGLISGTVTGSPARYEPFITATDGVVPFGKIFSLYAEQPNPTELDFPQAGTAAPDAVVGQSYFFGVVADGGTPPYTWAVAQGSALPQGLTLVTGAALPTNAPPDSTALTGYPTTPGPYTFTLIATDLGSATVTRTFTLNVTPVGLVVGNPRNGIEGSIYSEQLTAFGGTGPYTFTMSPTSPNQPTLPPGLTITPAGLISGIPASTGSYSSNLKVQDNAGHTFTKQVTLLVTSGSGIYITNVSNVVASAGTILVQVPEVCCNSATYSWSVSAGSLPVGLTLTPIGGFFAELLGTISVPGIYNFTLSATDVSNSSNFADYAYTMQISSLQFVSPPGSTPLISPLLPAGQSGTPYSFTFAVAGGTHPYTFSTSPLYPLPPGLNLSSSGVLSGTPSATGAFNLNVFVRDTAGFPNGVPLQTSLVITPQGSAAPLEASSGPGFSPASVGVPYETPLDRTVSGGTPPYIWTWAAAPNSALPAGLGIAPGGNGVSSYISGIPSAAGNYQIVLTVNDSGGQSLTLPSTQFSISSLAITPNSVSSGVVGTPYSVSFFPSGGATPYTLTSSFGTPPGLSLSSAGVLSGTPTLPGNFVFVLALTDGNDNMQSQFYEIAIDDAAGEAPAVSVAPKPVNVFYTVGNPNPSIALSVGSTSGNLPFTTAFSGIAGASLSASGGTTAAGGLNLNFSGSVLATPGVYSGLFAASAPGAVNQQDAVPIVLTVAAPVPCTYSLNPSGATIPAAGGTGSFAISTGVGCAWSTGASDPSVTITSATSGSANATINYSVIPNATNTSINSTITVAGQTYSITQFAAASCSFGIVPSTINATSSGGTAQIGINASDASCSWTASGLGVSAANGTGTGQVTVTIPAKTTAGAQLLNATIAGQTLTVNQTGADCTVSLSATSASILSGGTTSGSVNITTPAGCSYSTVPGPSWVSVTSGASGTGPGMLTYSVDPNSTTVARSGALTIGGVNFTVTEQPLACSLTLDTSNLGSPFAMAGGTGTIGIIANGSNCSWTASTSASWGKVLPSSGTGNGSVSVSTNGANSTSSALLGSVTIAGQSVNISQTGVTCGYSLRSSSGTVPASGGAGSVGVVAANGCTWTAVSNNPSWLTITSSGSSGTGEVQFVAQPNSSSSPQTGTLTIAGLTYTVTEAGASCSFTLGEPSVNVAAAGTGGNQNLLFTAATTGCTVAPRSYANWIHVVSSGLNGISGNLIYSVDPNPAGATRSGSIQVGDQLFLVSQTGADCAFSLNIYGAAFGQGGGNASFLGSPSALGCAPTTGVTLPGVTTLGTLTGPVNDIFTQPYSVSAFNSATNAIRKATITFGGQIFTIKQTSW